MVKDTSGEPADWAWKSIQEALRGLRFGEVRIIVQDGVIVKLERTERIRWPRPRKQDEV